METPSCFDELSYLRRYPDVAQAVAAKLFRSGLEHYEVHGIEEGRDGTYIDPSDTLLMDRFCSLGRGCELGIAQQFYGSNPPDLFRWGGCPSSGLIRMLEDRFSQINSFDVDVRGDNWWLYNKHYDLSYYSNIAASDATAEVVVQREQVRSLWLAKRLVADLRSARRIFVRWNKHGDENPDCEAHAILDAIRAFNPSNRLLSVRLADGKRRPPFIEERVGGHLLVGYIASFARGEDVSLTTNVHAWKALLEAANIRKLDDDPGTKGLYTGQNREAGT